MDDHGNGKEIKLERLSAAKEINFTHFTQTMFRHVCILSGCDYSPSIPGLGLKKAHALVKKYKSIDRVKISLYISMDIFIIYFYLFAILDNIFISIFLVLGVCLSPFLQNISCSRSIWREISKGRSYFPTSASIWSYKEWNRYSDSAPRYYRVWSYWFPGTVSFVLPIQKIMIIITFL